VFLSKVSLLSRGSFTWLEKNVERHQHQIGNQGNELEEASSLAPENLALQSLVELQIFKM
jgi:hypothetical protein